MLIRSQDKKRIANFSNVDSICMINYFNGEEIENEICSFNGVNDSKTNLGKYSTEEKAIKVLDMIQNAYVNYQYSKWVWYERETVIDCIYQMPKDCEV